MRRDNAAGLTLLELMVSISISAIVIALALSSWSYLNKHTLYQENKGTLRNETARIADEITLKLRRTPGLLTFTQNSVSLIDPSGNDTLEYAFDGMRLTRNGAPMHFGVIDGGITSFDLRNAAAGASEYLLLEVTISAKDKYDNRDTCRFVVNVKSRNSAVFSEQWDPF
jgi:prepilin-type N-terminal cleavage/methylation domain-containing protein